MKSRYWIVAGLACIAAAAASITALAASGVDLDDLPKEVQDAVAKQTDGAKLSEVEEETVDGKTIYEVEYEKDGKEVELTFSASGELLPNDSEEEEDDAEDEEDDEKGNDDEEEDEASAAIDSLPEAVREAAKNAADGGTLGEASKEREDGLTIYEVAYLKDGAEYEVEFAEDGTLLESAKILKADALPTEVKAALDKKFPGAKISETEAIELSFYEVALTANGKKHELRIQGNGNMLPSEDD